MMKCTSKKQQGTCRDRLSELPDEILVHILTFLPIKDAVRTVLLRRFGKLWTLLPTLRFEYGVVTRRYTSHVLRYHQNPTIDLSKFYLHRYRYPLGDETMAKDLKEWTNFALRKKTKALIVEYGIDGSTYFVPPHVFRNQCLVLISLFGLSIKLPRRVFMGSLQKLELCSVCISNEAFKELVSGCPCLQELIVRYPFELEKLHFTNPSIEKLELDFSVELDSSAVDRHYSLDCPNLKILDIEEVFVENLNVIDVSSIEEINIDFPSSVDRNYRNFMDDYFELLVKKFRNAQVFKMWYKTYMQLGPCVDMNWAFRKNPWRELAVSPGVNGSCMLGLCRLLRKSCSVVELVIYADLDIICDCNMLLPELSSCKMEKLTSVTIRNFVKPCRGLILLIEFLLKSAVVLDKLVIFCDNQENLLSLEGHSFILELLSFPRASRRARVVFS